MPSFLIKKLILNRDYVISEHIERDREYRSIWHSHIHFALKNGELYEKISEFKVRWRGLDPLERQLEMILSSRLKDIATSVPWERAEIFVVKTGYIPDGRGNDLLRKNNYLEKVK